MTKPVKPASDLDEHAPDGIALNEAELKEARHDGAKEAAKEAAKDTYTSLTDGVLPGAPPQRTWAGSEEVQPWADILDLGVDEFEKVVANKTDRVVPEEKAYGLLGMERNGQNRTPYVKALMKRLGLKKDELPGGGPDYTNDITPTSSL